MGVSLSTEIGFQRSAYSTDTWTWEIRPIIDKAVGRWYFAINPALERTLHGPDVKQGLGFAPSAKVSYDFTRIVSAGFEYYADYGALRSFAATHDQQQQLFLVTDLNVSPVWEINFGVSVNGGDAPRHRPRTWHGVLGAWRIIPFDVRALAQSKCLHLSTNSAGRTEAGLALGGS